MLKKFVKPSGKYVTQILDFCYQFKRILERGRDNIILLQNFPMFIGTNQAVKYALTLILTLYPDDDEETKCKFH